MATDSIHYHFEQRRSVVEFCLLSDVGRDCHHEKIPETTDSLILALCRLNPRISALSKVIYSWEVKVDFLSSFLLIILNSLNSIEHRN